MVDKKGFSIVEVMIASSIGIGIFLFLNKTIIGIEKSQKKFEKRFELQRIKETVITYLSDIRAWEESPEKEVPSIENKSQYYFFNKDNELVPLTFSENDLKEFKISCRKEIPNCRIAFFTYKGKIISNLNEVKLNNFMVQIGINENDKTSRSYLPELVVYLIDNANDNTLKISDQKFFVNNVNTSRFKKYSNGSYIVDPEGRVNCFINFNKHFPRDKEIGLNLCERALSSMPAKCYKHALSDFKLSSTAALLLCKMAKNPGPMDCFEEAKRRINAKPEYLAVLCAGARSNAPISCIEEIKSLKSSYDKNINYFLVCSRSEDFSSANCYERLNENKLDSISAITSLCSSYK